MSQLSFFDETFTGDHLPRHLLDYRPGIFTPEESRAFLETFLRETPWVQRVACPMSLPCS
jgi:hypothetical protein